jgi:hypothetical protein
VPFVVLCGQFLLIGFPCDKLPMLNGIIFPDDNPSNYLNGSQDQKNAQARQDSNNAFIMGACFYQ